mmetsp:Transcript_13615/g.24423  ORF Transcript_13615/g.24423 Transcript_13615/m.24423 type:complete len:325 (-) Transcript_13615:2033-3007(-)
MFGRMVQMMRARPGSMVGLSAVLSCGAFALVAAERKGNFGMIGSGSILHKLHHGLFSSLFPQRTFCKGAEFPALDSSQFVSLPLLKVKEYSHNSKVYVFGVSPIDEFPVSSFVLVKADDISDDGKPVIRPYTPINISLKSGEVELLIKRYPGGKMSNHIDSLKPGDSLLMKGPLKKFEVKPNAVSHCAMVAAGTGITPMFQVIKKSLQDKTDNTKLTLLYANISEEDILLHDELKELESKNPRLSVHYWVEKPSASWNGRVGRISKDAMAELLPKPGSGCSVLVCGPPPMVNAISGPKAKDKTQGELTGTLAELGYVKEEVFKM